MHTHAHVHPFTRIHVHVHTHTYTHAYTQTLTHSHTLTHTPKHKQTHIHTDAHTSSHTHTHTQAHAYTHIQPFIYTQMHSHTHTQAHTQKHITHMHTYTYTHARMHIPKQTLTHSLSHTHTHTHTHTHCRCRCASSVTHLHFSLVFGQGISAKPVDVYAFGILMYELFTGLKPWDGKNPAEIIHAVSAAQKRPVFPLHVPVPIVQLASECWHQQPEQRPKFDVVCDRLSDILTDTLATESVSRGQGGVHPPTYQQLVPCAFVSTHRHHATLLLGQGS
jgi:hypothetical protein